MEKYIPLLKTSNPNIQNRWIKICKEGQKKHDDWIIFLRKNNISAAHPDDGWIDRKNNRIHFAYPAFNDGIKNGSLVAIGNSDKYRIVKIIGHNKKLLLDYWEFKPYNK